MLAALPRCLRVLSHESRLRVRRVFGVSVRGGAKGRCVCVAVVPFPVVTAAATRLHLQRI